MVAPNKVDSNVTGLAIAQEQTPKVLPVTPIWYAQEPNSYNDFGGQISTVARDTINPSRQRQRGTTTDLDASGAFNTDFTQNNLTRLLQGFMVADAFQAPSTQSLNGAAIAITSVDGSAEQYKATSGLSIFSVGQIIKASGFGVPANNGIKVLTTVASGALTVAEDIVNEASPPASAKVETVGVQFASGDAAMSVVSGVATLTTVSKDLTTLGLNVGQWVFVGGDTSGTKFATSPAGYARIKTIQAHAITFDKVTGTFVTDAGTGKTVQLFFGTFIRNATQASEIVQRTYQVERQLGNDGDGIQSEYLEGAYPNELTITMPQANKLNSDLSFVAMNNTFRTGAQGVKSGTRIAALKEDAYNTSSNIYRARMNIIDPTTLQPSALFAYVDELTLTVKNNVTPAKALGVLGAFTAVLGTFEVGGSATAYFSTVAAAQAVKDNADVTVDVIVAKDNAGMVFDIPLMGLGGGRITVEKDQAIKIPLENLAAESAGGYTFGIVNFAYLPNAGMPT